MFSWLKKFFLASTPPVPEFDLTTEFLARVIEQIGCGEVGGNNRGPHVARYFRVPHEEGKSYGAWCARGTAWCLEEALGGIAQAAGHAWVSEKEWSVRSRAAIGLTRMLAAQFGETLPTTPPEPGMLALWTRGHPDGWQRHVAPVVEVVGRTFVCVEFNRGPVVKRFAHELGEPRLNKFVRVTAPRT